ncbi:hypothetical protein [Pseudoxanthomonas wuyuanensis]
MKRIAFLLGLLLLVIVAGCSTSGVAIPLGNKTYLPTSADSVVILAGPPARPFTDVALVDGTAATDDYFTQERTQAAALKAMKEKAAQLGAHAIIITNKDNRPYGGPLWEKLQISGKAIRYTDIPE